MSALISVVIPVYNVESYLKECLDSVVNQTHKNIQIILVDDGSTDCCGRICDEYAEKDKRIEVVHQSNQGAGGAKNTGLELIQGEYFSIIDSDDYLELDYYEKMLSNLIDNNVDVVQCLFSNVFKNNKYKRNYNFPCSKSRKIGVENFLTELLYDWKYAIFWNKLFKTSLLRKEIRFPVGRKIDDEFFTYKLICNANKILNINDCLYNYRMRKSSVMGSGISETLIKDRVDCFFERLSIINNMYPKLTNEYSLHINNYIKNVLCDEALSKKFKESLHIKLSKINIGKESVFFKFRQKFLFGKYVPDIDVFNLEEEELFE